MDQVPSEEYQRVVVGAITFEIPKPMSFETVPHPNGDIHEYKWGYEDGSGVQAFFVDIKQSRKEALKLKDYQLNVPGFAEGESSRVEGIDVRTNTSEVHEEGRDGVVYDANLYYGKRPYEIAVYPGNAGATIDFEAILASLSPE